MEERRHTSMATQSEEALLQPHEEQEQELEQQRLQNLNLKSFQILKSAVKNITSNTKFMFLMVLSMLPFFAFLVLFEIELPDILDVISNLLVPPSSYMYANFKDSDLNMYDENYSRRRAFRVVLELFPFYLILLPLIELFSSTIIINIAAKLYTGNKEASTVKETFYQKSYLKGSFITSLWVQLFSTSTLFGLIWAVVNHYIITNNGFYYDSGTSANILSIGFHAVIFVSLLNKYLEWSVSWNMGIVISVLEGETGLDALDLSAYYGKHCKQTGFRLMLIFFVYSVVLRFPFVIVRMCNYESVGVVTAIVAGLVCLGSLVKWVALVLYFYDCKTQVLLKKDDEEVNEAVKSDDLC